LYFTPIDLDYYSYLSYLRTHPFPTRRSSDLAFVTHIFHAHVAFELHVHTDGEEHGDDTGILTDRTVAHGAHTGVDQNLCHGVFGSLGFFTLVGFVNSLNEIFRVVVRNVLQCIGDALDQVFLLDHRHGRSLSSARGSKNAHGGGRLKAGIVAHWQLA